MVERHAVNVMVVGSSPTRGAKLYVRRLLPRRKAPRHAPCGRLGLILRGFATLRVAQKPIPVPAKFGSSQSFLENLFSQKDFPAKR